MARSAAFWTVFTVKSRVAWMTTAPCRLTQAIIAGRSLSSWPRPGSRFFRLPLVTGGVVEVIGFHGAYQLAIGFIGEGGIAQPPAPAIARTAMHPQLSRNTARGTRQAQQKGRENPVHDRALAAVQERAREVIEGALALLLFTAVALQAGLVVVGAPRTDVVALTPRTLEGPILPAQGMDIGVAGF